MKPFSRLILVLGLILSAAIPAFAGDQDPLFVNLTSDDTHRAQMALTFSAKQLERGHPLTVWLNDKGVLLGSKAKSAEYALHQKMLTEMMAKGAEVIICPMCMKHYGVAEADLVPGIRVGNPDLTGAALFKDHSQTLSW